MNPPRSLRPPAAVSAACFALSAVSFVIGWVLLVIAAPDAESFFYQPRVLAITHTFTLGWISLTIMGVLYQFVPALTKRPIAWARAAPYQVGLFAFGALGMVSHFWIGHVAGMEWSAGVVWISVALLLCLLLPPLLQAPQVDATVIGVVCGLLCFFGTATLGLLYAIDKVHPFLGGSVLSNIAGHAHLGLLGWVTLTICAVSYRLVAAFVLPEVLLPAPARRQIVVLACLVPALVIALLLRSEMSRLVAVAVMVTLAWYGALIMRMIRTRRMPIDWSIMHVVAALAHLAGAVAGALTLLFAVDPGTVLGNRVVLAYGMLALVGWVSNFIIGVASRLLAGLAGKGAQPLLTDAARAAVFGLLNVGLVAAVAAVLAGQAAVLRGAALLPLGAGLWFGIVLLRRLQPLRRAHRSAMDDGIKEGT